MRIVIIASLLAACGTDDPQFTYDLDPHLSTCTGFGPGLCMSGVDQDGESTLLFDGIEGFEFRWGETRRVTVVQHPVDNPPADGSAFRLELLDDELLSTAAATDTFELEFRNIQGSLLDESTAADRVKLGEFELACDPAICASVVGREDEFALELTFAAPAGTVATIQQVR